MALYRSILAPGLRGMYRTFSLSPATLNASLSEQFEAAKSRLNQLKDDPGNDTKLQLYALFKQATMGKCGGKRPGMTDFVGRAKWDAWNALGDISKEDAQKKYIGVIDRLVSKDTPSSSGGQPVTDARGDVYSEVRGKTHVIVLNRADKKNALRTDMYNEISALLDKAAKDDTSICVITGMGDYYCSGNDLANFNVDMKNIAKMASDANLLLQRFVSAFIDFPKPLIAVVNGPAVGISVTVLGLCDAVLATDRATFHTPFTALGQSPEGCSSYTFPRMMGHAAACEMLLFNKKITAAEAKQRGLVSQIFPDASFQTDAWEIVSALSKLPPKSLSSSKMSLRVCEQQKLHEVNKSECERLVVNWQSEECLQAIMNFFKPKK